MFQAFRTPGTGEQMIMDNNMFVEATLPGAMLRKMGGEEMNRYREPYPDRESRRPLWRWPNEIPIDGEPADGDGIVPADSEWLGEAPRPELLGGVEAGASQGGWYCLSRLRRGWFGG